MTDQDLERMIVLTTHCPTSLDELAELFRLEAEHATGLSEAATRLGDTESAMYQAGKSHKARADAQRIRRYMDRDRRSSP